MGRGLSRGPCLAKAGMTAKPSQTDLREHVAPGIRIDASRPEVTVGTANHRNLGWRLRSAARRSGKDQVRSLDGEGWHSAPSPSRVQGHPGGGCEGATPLCPPAAACLVENCLETPYPGADNVGMPHHQPAGITKPATHFARSPHSRHIRIAAGTPAPHIGILEGASPSSTKEEWHATVREAWLVTTSWCWRPARASSPRSRKGTAARNEIST